MTLYVALLRGINVGGNNLIKMADLKRCFEEQGFADVATYIQSGNVLFEADGLSQHELTKQVEDALTHAFNHQSWVVLRSGEQMQQVVARAPAGFGREPAAYHYDVIFLKEPLSAADALKDVKVKPGVDAAFAGDGVLYFSRLISRATQSYLSRIVALPVYQGMTIRNWNTTSRLLALLVPDRRSSAPTAPSGRSEEPAD